MKKSYVLLALSRGLVTVSREVVVNVEGELFNKILLDFTRKHTNDTVLFFEESELEGFLRQINDRRQQT